MNFNSLVDKQWYFCNSFNEIWIPVPNIRRDSVCRSSFASDFDPFDETSFILSRQNSDAFFDLSTSPVPMITLTCYDSDECHCNDHDEGELEEYEKPGDEPTPGALQCVVPIVIDVTPPTPPSTTPIAQCSQVIPFVFVSFDEDEAGIFLMS